MPESGQEPEPASSFGSNASGGGSGPESTASPAAPFNRPQPVNVSRPKGQRRQPLPAFASVAVRSRIVVTWFGRRFGATENSIAAAALTWGAANDVPSASR